MKTLFAVHHVFDCLEYNEHYYFESFTEAFDRLTEIKNSIQKHLFIYDIKLDEVYTDHQTYFHVHTDDGQQRVYIQEINL